MRLTIALTTYERPDALAAVLRTLAAQTAAPDELIVADDGSSAPTRTIVEQFAKDAPYPVRHLWQEHRGFRAARLRNLAIAQATGEYIVFVDADMLLHPAFIADHRRFARRGAFTQGVRIPLDEPTTRRALADPNGLAPERAAFGRRRLYTFHSPILASLSRRLANAFIAIKSCNQGFWRSDLIAVNGFNEDFIGWGPEDKELCARLEHHGVARQTLLFGAIAFHLHHPPASRDRRALNEQLLAATRSNRSIRCDHGVDAHLTRPARE